MVARPADAGAGLFKLVAPDDGLTQWSARRMVGEMANDVRRAGPASACRRNRLADIAAAWTDYLHHCKQQGLHLFSPGTLCFAAIWQERPLQFFPWPDVDAGASQTGAADKHTNAGMLRERFNYYYCEKVVKIL